MLTNRFEQALLYATRKHAGQERKGTRVPYVSHLLGVASLVLEDGGDEDEAIAALLHDVVEDRGGREALKEIRTKFGDRVAKIVDGCTDADTLPKPPWRQRKEAYIKRLRQKDREIRRVSLADKLHNSRAILRDFRLHGEDLWSRFTGGKEGTLWYYRSLLQVFKETGSGPMGEELGRVVAELEELAAASQSR